MMSMPATMNAVLTVWLWLPTRGNHQPAVKCGRPLGIVPTTGALVGGFIRLKMLVMAMEMIVTVSGPSARSQNSFLRICTARTASRQRQLLSGPFHVSVSSHAEKAAARGAHSLESTGEVFESLQDDEPRDAHLHKHMAADTPLLSALAKLQMKGLLLATHTGMR